MSKTTDDLKDWIIYSRNDAMNTRLSMTIYVNRLSEAEKKRLEEIEGELRQLCHQGEEKSSVSFGRGERQ